MPEIPEFRLGFVPTVHSVDPVVLSKLYGPNFEKSKLELVEFSSWQDLIDALGSGSVQGASIPAALDFEAAENGLPIKIISKSHRHGNALIVANDVSSLAALKGQKIAVPELVSTHTVFLYRALGNDTSLGGIQLVEMAPDKMGAALARGEIKGYIADQYIGAEDVLAGRGRLLYRSQDIWKNETCCVLALRSDFIDKYPGAVQELTNGYVGSGFFIDKNHNMTVPTCGDQIKMDKKTMDECFKWGVSYASLRPVREDLGYLYDSLVRLKHLKSTLDINSTLDDSFISLTYKNSELLAPCG
ncbi:MAG TPA: ABC transporter substrate-binding protein [Methanotrichaceae archaeon]|nr:ABC transporter substrate-binding protein [Methanotrichaceae archaeon]